MYRLIHNEVHIFNKELPYRVCVCVCVRACVHACVRAPLLLPQFWDNYIQTCYIGSAWPQLVYQGVFIFASGLGGAEEGRQREGRKFSVNLCCVAPPPGGRGYYNSSRITVQYSCLDIFQCSEVFGIIKSVCFCFLHVTWGYFFAYTKLSVAYTLPK